MIIFLLMLIDMAILVFKAIAQIAIVIFLLVIGIVVVCSVFKDEVDQDGITITRGFERTMGIGCVFLISGVLMWVDSMNGYKVLLSGTLVLGEPRPGAVILVFFGIVILIYGAVKKHREKRE